jgi:hypothetical protein
MAMIIKSRRTKLEAHSDETIIAHNISIGTRQKKRMLGEPGISKSIILKWIVKLQLLNL